MILNATIIAGITLALFFISLILSKQKKHLPDHILITWLGILSFHLFVYLIENNLLPGAPVLEELSGAFVFLHGPLIYLYTLRVHNLSFSSFNTFFHIIPFFINTLAIPVLIITNSYSLAIVFLVLKSLSLFIYLGISMQNLKSYDGSKKQLNNKQEVKWIKHVIIGLLSICTIGIVSQIITDIGVIRLGLQGELFVPFSVCLLIITIGYNGLKQTNIFIDNLVLARSDISTPVALPKYSGNKYEKTGLSAEQSRLKYQELNTYITQYKTYTNSELTLKKLATETNLPANQLSQIINQNTSRNFYWYINNFRVNEVIKQLKHKKHEHLTLLSIAYDAGFSSKASFNRVFKNSTGLTPSQFIKQLEVSEEHISV